MKKEFESHWVHYEMKHVLINIIQKSYKKKNFLLYLKRVKVLENIDIVEIK